MPNLPLLLGHRGARSTPSVAENTLASFDLALKHGCDGFEFDVRLAGSGRLVVCHDPRVNGVTVSCATRKQLLDLPQLEDVLERYARRVFLDIEIKVKGMESTTLAALRAHEPERNYVISSFIPEVVMELRARSATSPLGIICDKPAQLARWQKLPVDYVIPHESLVSPELIEEIHGAERRILAWTVNDKKSMLRLADWGIDGLISDDTELLVSTFS